MGKYTIILFFSISYKSMSACQHVSIRITRPYSSITLPYRAIRQGYYPILAGYLKTQISQQGQSCVPLVERQSRAPCCEIFLENNCENVWWFQIIFVPL